MANFNFIKTNPELELDPGHVEALCRYLLSNKTIYDGKNFYAPRPSIDGHIPTDAEINAALDQFREKGYLIAYDNEVCEYRVCKSKSDIKGEHAIRRTIWI